MTEHPILFSTEMVKAILEGRKTQTRRVMKPQPLTMPMRGRCEVGGAGRKKGMHSRFIFVTDAAKDVVEYKCPYGDNKGDRLWVRETFSKVDKGNFIIYKADGLTAEEYGIDKIRWKPSIFMPRAASRITLEITDIRVERVQDISEVDAKAEGIAAGLFIGKAPDQYYVTNRDGTKRALSIYQNEYRFLWDKLNEKRGYAFHTNPFVWVIEFKRIKQ